MRASAVIIKNNKVLLMHRKKKGDEYWVFIGGSIEDGEDGETAIIREIKEETSLDTTFCKYWFDYIDDEDVKHPVYFCKVSEGEPVLGGPEKEKHSQENWYHPEWVELDNAASFENIYPDEGKILLNEILNGKRKLPIDKT